MRNAYRFKLSNGHGGTYITDEPLHRVRRLLSERFPKRRLISVIYKNPQHDTITESAPDRAPDDD